MVEYGRMGLGMSMGVEGEMMEYRMAGTWVRLRYRVVEDGGEAGLITKAVPGVPLSGIM